MRNLVGPKWVGFLICEPVHNWGSHRVRSGSICLAPRNDLPRCPWQFATFTPARATGCRSRRIRLGTCL